MSVRCNIRSPDGSGPTQFRLFASPVASFSCIGSRHPDFAFRSFRDGNPCPTVTRRASVERNWINIRRGIRGGGFRRPLVKSHRFSTAVDNAQSNPLEGPGMDRSKTAIHRFSLPRFLYLSSAPFRPLLPLPFTYKNIVGCRSVFIILLHRIGGQDTTDLLGPYPSSEGIKGE